MRRFQTLEFKIAATLTFLSLFLPPRIYNLGEISESIKYGYFFSYITIVQDKDNLRKSLFSNLFNNKSFGMNILDMFLNIIIFYCIVRIIKNIYLKYKAKSY